MAVPAVDAAEQNAVAAVVANMKNTPTLDAKCGGPSFSTEQLSLWLFLSVRTGLKPPTIW